MDFSTLQCVVITVGIAYTLVVDALAVPSRVPQAAVRATFCGAALLYLVHGMYSGEAKSPAVERYHKWETLLFIVGCQLSSSYFPELAYFGLVLALVASAVTALCKPRQQGIE